jgi:hypothetical protein
MKFNKTHFALRALFIAGIGILSASAPIPTQISAMETPSNICGTCRQQKPHLNLFYLSIRANRCSECRAILTKPASSSELLTQIKAEFGNTIQILQNQSVNHQQLHDLQTAFETRIQALEARIAKTEAYITEQQINKRSPWIARSSWFLGTVAAAIAYDRKYTANQSALIGLGTAATSYAIATLALKK